MTTLSSLASFALLDTSKLRDGSEFFVNTMLSPYKFRRSVGADTPSGSLRVAGSGSGLFYRDLSSPHPSWLNQAAWIIDPVSGNDENSGIDASHKIKTHNELAMRWGKDTPTGITVDVSILSALNAGDLIRIERGLTASGFLRYKGTATQLATGTLTAGTANANYTTTMAVIEDTVARGGGGWTPYLNKRIRTSSGKIAWITADLGSGKAEVTQASSPTSAVIPIPGSFAETQFASGDTYFVEDLVNAKFLIDVVGPFDRTTATGDCFGSFENFFDSNSTGDDHMVVRTTSATPLHFYGCQLNTVNVDSGAQITSWGCRIGNTQCRGGWLQYVSYITGDNLSQIGGDIWIDYDTIAKGATSGLGRARQGGTIRIGAAASFNGSTYGFIVRHGGHGLLDLAGAGTTRLWGTGNATAGVSVEPGCSFGIKTGITPTITGTGGDVRVGDVNTYSWSDTPIFDPISDASVVTLP